MQRLFWCGTVVIVWVAAGAYMAACYVERHPETLLSRCAIFAYRLGTDHNPVVQVGYRVAERAHHKMYNQVTEFIHAPDPTCPSSSNQPFDFMNTANYQQGQEGLNIIQTQPLHEVQAVTPGTMTSSFEYQAAPMPSYSPTPGYYAEGQASIMIEPGSVEESEDLPKTMPPCDETKTDTAPDTMPYCEEDAGDVESNQLYQYWKDLFEKDVEEKLKMDGIKDDKIEKNEGKEEESEPAQAESQMQDQDYHHHHDMNHCPGTVVCPYTGRSYPVDPEPTTPPTTAPKKEKKDKSGNPKQTRSSRKVPIPDDCGDEDCPVHPEVDTMEFRKSDAHKGEFNPKPM